MPNNVNVYENSEDKNYNLVHYIQGADSESRIVLLESELIETQELLRNTFSKAVKTIAGKNRIYITSIQAEPTVIPVIPEAPTPGYTPVNYNVSISNIYMWTELGYIKNATVETTLTPMPASSSEIRYLYFEIYETIVTGDEDSSLIDVRVTTATASRRKINIRLASSNTGYPSSVSLNTGEYNGIVIPVGSFVRENTGTEKWHTRIFDFVNAFAVGNDVSLYDESSSTEFNANIVNKISASRIDDLGFGEYKLHSLRFQQSDSPSTSKTNDLGYNTNSGIDILRIPADNITNVQDIGGVNVMELQFPTTIQFSEGNTTNVTNGVQNIEIPYQSYTEVSAVDPITVKFDPVLNEKSSLYNSLLAQGSSFLFSRYSGVFFYPEEQEGQDYDLILDSSSANVYYSRSNGVAEFDLVSRLVLETKNLVLQGDSDLTKIMVLYDALENGLTLDWKYQTNLVTTWTTLPTANILDLASGTTSFKLQITATGSTSGATAILKSIAIFHSPIASPNIYISDTANWEEVVAPTSAPYKVYSLTNIFTPNTEPSMIEVFVKENSSDLGWTKLVRGNAGEEGTYTETDANTITLNRTLAFNANTRILVRPIASAISTNDTNGLLISNLESRVDDLEGQYVKHFFASNEVDTPSEIGVFSEIGFTRTTPNIALTYNPTGDRNTIKIGYNNYINTNSDFQDYNSASGSAPNPFDVMQLQNAWGAPTGAAANPQIGTDDGNTITVSQIGTTATMLFKGLYFKNKTGTTPSFSYANIGIPKIIQLKNGLYATEIDPTAGFIDIAFNPGNGLKLKDTTNDAVEVKPYNGIIVDANGVSAKPYNGIAVDTNGIQAVSGNAGILVDSSGINAVASKGLTIDSSSGLALNWSISNIQTLNYNSGIYTQPSAQTWTDKGVSKIYSTVYIGVQTTTYNSYDIRDLEYSNIPDGQVQPEIVMPTITFDVPSSSTSLENIVSTFFTYIPSGSTTLKRMSCKFSKILQALGTFSPPSIPTYNIDAIFIDPEYAAKYSSTESAINQLGGKVEDLITALNASMPTYPNTYHSGQYFYINILAIKKNF